MHGIQSEQDVSAGNFKMMAQLNAAGGEIYSSESLVLVCGRNAG
jgi:hypothetical protein